MSFEARLCQGSACDYGNHGKVNEVQYYSMFGAKKSPTPVPSNVSNPSWHGTAVIFVSKSRTRAAQCGDDCWDRTGL